MFGGDYIVGIDYNPSKPESYKGVYIWRGSAHWFSLGYRELDMNKIYEDAEELGLKVKSDGTINVPKKKVKTLDNKYFIGFRNNEIALFKSDNPIKDVYMALWSCQVIGRFIVEDNLRKFIADNHIKCDWMEEKDIGFRKVVGAMQEDIYLRKKMMLAS
ncbi:MAG: hypothetical protein OHK0047_02680 [Leptolyngbyaceae cyanobacterium]